MDGGEGWGKNLNVNGCPKCVMVRRTSRLVRNQKEDGERVGE